MKGIRPSGLATSCQWLRSAPPFVPGCAGRELLEVLWSAGRPLTTRQLQDAIARAFPHRAGRKIQSVSTLLAELMAQGWVAGEKRGGTRWAYRPAVTRSEGLTQIARWVVEKFVREPEDRLCLIREGLRIVGFVPVVGSPESYRFAGSTFLIRLFHRRASSTLSAEITV